VQRAEIVIFTDDQRVLCELPEQLRLDGYQPHVARARRQFWWALSEFGARAVVLGDLPTLAPTLALLRQLRGHEADAGLGVDPDVPVLVLSGGRASCASCARSGRVPTTSSPPGSRAWCWGPGSVRSSSAVRSPVAPGGSRWSS
jgi:hypothetical protein